MCVCVFFCCPFACFSKKKTSSFCRENAIFRNKKQRNKTLDQFLTCKKANLGPVFYSTAYIYIYLFTYLHTYMHMATVGLTRSTNSMKHCQSEVYALLSPFPFHVILTLQTFGVSENNFCVLTFWISSLSLV